MDASTRVKVYKWALVESTAPFLSRGGGKPYAIAHKHLVHPTQGTVRSDRGWDRGDLACHFCLLVCRHRLTRQFIQVKLRVPRGDNAAYVTEKFPENDRNGKHLPIPDGTIGRVHDCTTASVSTNASISWSKVLSAPVGFA